MVGRRTTQWANGESVIMDGSFLHETRNDATRGGGLQAAIMLARNEDLDVRRYASICLCNMANNPTTQVQVVVHGGLPPLMDLATSNDVDSQRHSLMALANLVANESNHQAMVSKGLVKVLMKLSQSPDPDVREYATFNLANLASNPDHLNEIGRASCRERV